MALERKTWVSRFVESLRDFLEGAIIREPMLVAIKERAMLERTILLAVFGDTLGIPVPGSYYTLRLARRLFMVLEPWKCRMPREKDWTDGTFD
jgi:hypothetical protein